MNDLPLFASAYSIFLAGIAALLARAPARAATTWPEGEVSRFRLVLARTLVVLALFIVVAAAARAPGDGRSYACLAAAVIVGAAVGWSALRPRGPRA